jgi:hypothetical protein
LRDASLSAPKFQDFSDERAALKRRGAAPQSDPARAPRKKRSLLARVFGPQRMGLVLLLGIGGLALVGVPMNALFLQDGRHPAPLFTAQSPLPEKDDVAATPTPPMRPTQIPAARAETDAAKPETPSRIAPRAVAKNDAGALKAEIMKAEAPVRPERKRDPIGQLLGGGESAPAETPDKNVAYAQRALQKLGYVVKPDGVLGGGTRQAIEKFERDNGLPAKGELNARVVKLLATRSGLARQ